MEERELISFIISSLVMIFVLFQWPVFRNISKSKMLFICYFFLFLSWGFSLIEGFFWEHGFNFLQHLCSGISGIIIAVWCRYLNLKDKTKRIKI